jgi:tRNA dimethylallyltransferase
MTLPKIIIITGPTASGKSALAVDIAGRVGGRIVSADSAAVYRYLDIGTAKPPADVRAQIPHDLIDVIDPDRQYNAMAYARAADEAIGKIVAGGAVPIIAGGTGLYLKALVFGIFELPGSPGGGTVREELGLLPTERLRCELEQVDAESAHRIGRSDRVRLIRALEIYRLAGVPKSEMEARYGFSSPRYDRLTFCLSTEKDLLDERIDRRVDEMIAHGIVREVQGLLDMGYGPGSPGLKTIGYKEIVDYLTGKTGLEEAIFLIKRNTRRYAKRQMTWFRKMDGVQWIHYPYDIVGITDCIWRFLERTP